MRTLYITNWIKHMRRIFSKIILLLILTLLISCQMDREVPKVEKGVIDLTSYDLEADGPVRLDGEWSFYWEPEEFDSVGFDHLKEMDVSFHEVPDVWTDDDYGYCIYHIKIKTNGNNTHYAIYTLGIGTAAEFYVDGKLIGNSGHVGRNREETYPMGYNEEYFFESEETEINLHIKLSNFHHWQGGIWSSIVFGQEADVKDMFHKLLFYYISLISVLSVLGVYLILNYFLFGKIPSNLYLGVFCLLLALRFSIDETGIINIFVESLHRVYFTKSSYLTLNLIVASFILYIRGRFPYETYRNIDFSIIFISLLYFVIVLTTKINQSTALMPYYQIVIICGLLYVVYVIIKAIRNRRAGAFIFFYGFVFLSFVIVNDILNSRQLINSVDLFTLGILIFIISEVIFMSRNSRLKYLRDRTEKISSESKKGLITNISHEFRTPMNSIIGYLEMVLDRAKLDSVTKDYLTTSYKSAQTLLKLINDFLDLRKIETNSLDVIENAFNLEFEIKYIISVLEPLVEERDIELTYLISKEVPKCIKTDMLKFRQILINLMNNAIKFTEKGFVNLNVEVRNSKLVFIVKDTGIGIAQEDFDLIFYSFKQLDHSMTRKYTGSGLGLSIAKEFSRLLGGDITVTSSINHGSEFTVTLPIKLANCTHECDERCKQVDYIIKTNTKRYLTILVADDVMENAELIKIRLQMMGHQVDVVYNGKEAVDASLIKNYDLILLDMYMPVMDGYEATKIIKKEGKDSDIRIIAISANDMDSDKEILETEGFDGVLSKPVDFDELDNIMNKIVPKYRGSLIPHKQNRKELTPKESTFMLDGIDLAGGIELWQDEELYFKSLISFKSKFLKVTNEWERLLREKKYDLLYDEFHKIKGVSGNLYLTKIKLLSNNLCIMLKNKNYSELDNVIKSLSKEFKVVLKSIDSLEKSVGTNSGKDSSDIVKFIDRLIILNKRESLDLEAITELEVKMDTKLEEIKHLVEIKEYAAIEVKLKWLKSRH